MNVRFKERQRQAAKEKGPPGLTAGLRRLQPAVQRLKPIGQRLVLLQQDPRILQTPQRQSGSFLIKHTHTYKRR